MNAIRNISAVLCLSSLALTALGDVPDRSVTTQKLVDGAVRAAHLGPTVIVRRGGGVPVAPGTSNVAVADCLDGETRLSGGGNFGFGPNRGIQATFPQGTGWVVWGRNNTAQEQILSAVILCLQN